MINFIRQKIIIKILKNRLTTYMIKLYKQKQKTNHPDVLDMTKGTVATEYVVTLRWLTL